MAKDDIICYQFTSDQDRKQASINGRKGGKASAKARAEKKAIREELDYLLSIDNNRERISVALINKALDGDVRAFEVIRDTIGEKPINKVDVDADIEIIVDIIED